MKGSEAFPTETNLSRVYEFSCRTAAIARMQGLLALEEMTRDSSLPPLYRTGLKMVIDGAPPEEISREMARNELYRESILSLQRGESEEILKLRLAAHRGAGALSKILATWE